MNDALLQQVAQLQTAEKARQAIHDYCLALDTGDFALLARTFTHDIVLGLPGNEQVKGIDAVLSFFKDATARQVTHRKHFSTNVTIRSSDAEQATGESYFLSILGDPGDLTLAWGRFAFVARRTGDDVQIARLDLLVEQAPVPVSFLSTGS